MFEFRYLYKVGALLIGIILGVLGTTSLGSAANAFIIGSPVSEGSPDGVFQRLFITEVYRRVGIEAEVKYYPPKRCSNLANAGEINGETERVFDYNTMYPNMIRVNVMTRTFKFGVYAAKPNICLEGDGWEMLKNIPYKVEYQRGIKKSQEILTKLIPRENLSEINQIEQERV